MLYKNLIELSKRIFGDILVFYHICDIKQLPSVARKPIADDFDPKTSYNIDAISISLLELMDLSNEHKRMHFSFHRTDIVRKQIKNSEIFYYLREKKM